MMNKTTIEWTDKTWNPVTGCTKVSQGCKNCYAERMYERFNGHGTFKNVQCHDDRLEAPKKWKEPSKIFVNSMSDLFHKDVPFQFIIEVFHTMAACKQHTFQILTKRSERMLEFFTDCAYNPYGIPFNPLPNVWLGVSVENQEAATKHISNLLQVPAAIRFLSCEPLLDKIDIISYLTTGSIHWVIAGGESGPKARPMHPDWVRSLKNQCCLTEVPFFFKQWGEYVQMHDLMVNEPGIAGKRWFTFDPETSVCMIGKKKAGRLLDGVEHNEFPIIH